MTEEEAIEILNNWADYEVHEEREDYEIVDTAINTILNLIDKQQKEIEEEKEKWKELFHEYNKLVGEVIDKEQDLKDSISKDKIRDKIENYKILAEKSLTRETLYIYKNILYVLERLLEE